ncbi:MAG: hypothetical protein ACREO8_07535 [Luteimonas sp.]
MTSNRRLALALLWLALLALAGWWIAAQVRISGDLRKFMPARGTPADARRPDAARAAEKRSAAALHAAWPGR